LSILYAPVAALVLVHTSAIAVIAFLKFMDILSIKNIATLNKN
jgi:hypothetical protein